MSRNDSPARKVIQISDNYAIILSLHSSLYKPIHSLNTNKNFSLDGDAFFEIPEQQDSPVIIHTGMLHLISSGAFFRVYAHGQNPGQTAEVLRGNVIAEKAYPSDFPDTEILHAGDMVMINKEIDLMEKETFDTSKLAVWLQGDITFKNTPFNDAMRNLENWFDIEIEIQSNHADLDDSAYNITGTFHNPGLKTILDILSKEKKFKFTIGKNRVGISF